MKEKKRLLELALAVDESEGGTKQNEKAERSFHEALIDLVNSPLLSAEFRKIMLRRLFFKVNMVAPWHTQLPLDNHEKLLKKLTTKNPDEAEAAIRQHLERGREGLLK